VVSHPSGIFVHSTGSCQKWPTFKSGPDVSHWDCVCRNCGEEFKSNASKDEYIPRWVCKTETKVSLALKCALSKQGVKNFVLWEVLRSYSCALRHGSMNMRIRRVYENFNNNDMEVKLLQRCLVLAVLVIL